MSAVGKPIRVLLALALLAGLASMAAAADNVEVKLAAVGDSGESGTATLTPVGKDETKVVLTVEGAKGTQPVHIHKGTCAQLDPKPSFPLSPIKKGKSTTTVKASLDELQSGSYAINAHKSAKDVKTYVLCGDIPKK